VDGEGEVIVFLLNLFYKNDMKGKETERKSAIRAILFDFGGVLAEDGFKEGIYALAQQQELNPAVVHKAAFKAVYDSGYVVGRGTEADFFRLLRQKTGLNGEDNALREAMLSRFVLRPRMLAIVRTLRQHGYITAILSDQTDWLDQIDSKVHFFQEFDKVYSSFHLGKGKRDPSLFGDVIDDLHLLPQQALFVDNDPVNVTLARSRGLKTLVFTDEAQFKIDLGNIVSHQILQG
jgi:putative hydrolase of the HAD superfamily